jgi:hypothetical protein
VFVCSCTLGGAGSGVSKARAISGTGTETILLPPMAENPKRAANLATSSLDTTLACTAGIAAENNTTAQVVVQEKLRLVGGWLAGGGAGGAAAETSTACAPTLTRPTTAKRASRLPITARRRQPRACISVLG